MRQDDFNCEKGRREGRIEVVIEGPGSYHRAWCPVKEDYIPNCNYCEYNELEKEAHTDPNNYKEWLKRGGKHKYMNELDDFLCEIQSDELPECYEALLNAVEDEYYIPDYI